MRIVIDMQGAQTDSRFRGIGRYTLSFGQAIVRNRREHEVILVLSGLFPDTIEPIRAAFEGLLPQENIRVWYAPGPVKECEPGNEWRREVAELIREAFLASLAPDVVHVSSPFEGYADDAVTSIGRFDRSTPVSVSLYDLIPLLNPEHYLKPNPRYAEYYQRKVDHLKQAAVYLAISEFTRQEGLAHLAVPESRIVNVATAIESHFKHFSIDDGVAAHLRQKFGLSRPFILYAGGTDERKNLLRLIQAFAALPAAQRTRFQLLFAGKMTHGDLANLQHQAKSAGLEPGELCFTGYVPDEELVQLYNLCELFVFPSWHEGFGLPALEAMACGAPVIGANTSSLPDVIGLDAALFDPLDVAAIAAKMTQALEDDAFRATLRKHGLQQAKHFSWDESAKRAIAAWASLKESQQEHTTTRQPVGRKPRLAFVSPLPPERTGIADYSAELLPALAEHYTIEVVVAQDRVDDPWVKRHGKVRDVSWLRAHANEIDRVLYQVGNSPFHQHMLPLLEEIPGTVVLHDFYMSGLMSWLELHAGADYAWTGALYASHGYGAVRERYRDIELAKRGYPVNLNVLQRAQGLIVHSEYSRKLAKQWYGEKFADTWEVIPLLRTPAGALDKAAARKQLGLDGDDFVVCSFGFLDSTKLNHRVLNAWLRSALAGDTRCKLVFVGENHGGDYGSSLMQTIRSSGLGDRIHITGFASPEMFRQYLAAADLAVQLRASSRGETSAAVLDCMNHALPLIVNANGSMAELDPQAAWILPDEFDDAQLTEAMETLWREPERRHSLGERGREIILGRHAPAVCAERYVEVIERSHRGAEVATPALIRAIAAHNRHVPGNAELLHLSSALSATLPLSRPVKCLFLDVTATCRDDLKTGIERVARALLLALLEAPPAGYRVEPVYISDNGGVWHYRYARHYTLGLLRCPPEALDDERVEPECGDVLLGLDISGDTLVRADRAGLFADYRIRGVKVYSLVFDLLPIRMPEVFPPGADEGHVQWLQTISKFDGAICISKAVAEDLFAWQAEAGFERQDRRSFQVGWFHLGADVAKTAPSRGMPADAEWTLKQLRSRSSFLMVGTIEPRKGYLQTIEAFSQLWNDGIDVNLVIVGKEGWRGLPDEMRRDIPKTIGLLTTHPELNKRLFWLDGISDEYLEAVYAASTCLIAASYGEGFGLPLIEAAQHELPIIARDIPVFREVAGSYAHYFDGTGPSDMSEAITEWLARANGESHVETMPLQTWRESAQNLIKLITEGDVAANSNELFADVSVVYRSDFHTGIQRAVRALLLELIENPPKGYQVAPVYLDEIDGQWGYYRAEKSLHKSQKTLAGNISSLTLKEIRPRPGDILLGLDFAGGYVIAATRQGLYTRLKEAGAKVFFIVYDLLPITAPEFFKSIDSENHALWLECVSKGDGAICISRSVANEFVDWHRSRIGDLPEDFSVNYFHLGADIERSSPTYGLPEDAEHLLFTLRAKLSFLMVGTIEPRKGYAQVLEAFETLWRCGQDVNLVIIGKQGWMVEELVDRLRAHPELNKRLFWLEGVSDECLEAVYAASTCLIAASFAEGFGLPLVEAAQHQLPIIARDIPVFREVAGEHAFYFSSTEPEDLASAIQQWTALDIQNAAPQSKDMPWLTWKKSAAKLMDVLLEGESGHA